MIPLPLLNLKLRPKRIVIRDHKRDVQFCEIPVRQHLVQKIEVTALYEFHAEFGHRSIKPCDMVLKLRLVKN